MVILTLDLWTVVDILVYTNTPQLTQFTFTQFQTRSFLKKVKN